MEELRYGILIAESKYEDPRLQNLQCPESDVDGLNEILKQKDLGNFAETFVLKNADNGEVLIKINQILKKAGKNDLVLIYYSGHGKLNDAGKLHLATANTNVDVLESTSIPVDTIKNYTEVSPSNRVVLILDSCFSGAVGESFIKGDVGDQLQLISGGRGLYIITASTAIQTALEKEGERFSTFTKHLIKGIISGEADIDNNGVITLDELYKYVHDNVLAESHQEPTKWGLNIKGDLAISFSGKESRKNRAMHLRKKLLEYAENDLIPDTILTESLQLSSLEKQGLSNLDAIHDQLLDQLLESNTNINDFISNWTKATADNLNLNNGSPIRPGFGQQHLIDKKTIIERVFEAVPIPYYYFSILLAILISLILYAFFLLEEDYMVARTYYNFSILCYGVLTSLLLIGINYFYIYINENFSSLKLNYDSNIRTLYRDRFEKRRSFYLILSSIIISFIILNLSIDRFLPFYQVSSIYESFFPFYTYERNSISLFLDIFLLILHYFVLPYLLAALLWILINVSLTLKTLAKKSNEELFKLDTINGKDEALSVIKDFFMRFIIYYSVILIFISYIFENYYIYIYYPVALILLFESWASLRKIAKVNKVKFHDRNLIICLILSLGIAITSAILSPDLFLQIANSLGHKFI